MKRSIIKIIYIHKTFIRGQRATFQASLILNATNLQKTNKNHKLEINVTKKKDKY